MEGFRGLLNQIKFAWISLILSIKSFFSSNKHTSSNTSSSRQNASNGDDHNNNTRETSVENKIETKGNEIDSEDEQEEFYDALEELTEPETLSDLESDEEYFDAVEDLQNEQENSERKEYEENKYYNLQNSLQEKTKFDRSTATLALAFEISELPQLRDCNPDFSKFKLCELKQNGDKYTFTLEDNRKNRIELHSEYLNIYFPKYFEKHRKKGTYTKLFSEKENRISNDIIIPLQVPKEVSILTKEPNWLIKKVTGEIPDFPIDVHLKDCKDHVNFCLNSSDAISLSMTSMGTKSAARLSGTPVETNWPIKDILIRGGFINQHTDEQPEVEEISSDSEFEYIEVDQVNQTSQRK